MRIIRKLAFGIAIFLPALAWILALATPAQSPDKAKALTQRLSTVS